jgi:predicted RND superfamily exporter protein
MLLIVASSGAQARFATVMLGGVVFSTIAALTALPVLISRIAECSRFIAAVLDLGAAFEARFVPGSTEVIDLVKSYLKLRTTEGMSL